MTEHLPLVHRLCGQFMYRLPFRKTVEEGLHYHFNKTAAFSATSM